MHRWWSALVLIACNPPGKRVPLPAGELRIEVAVRPGTADDIERTIAVPLEAALGTIPGIARITTRIAPEQLTFAIELAEPARAMLVMPFVETRLAGTRHQVSLETGDSYRMLDPDLGAPEPPVIPLMRVQRCEARFEVAIDPARLAAQGIAVDELAAAIAAHHDSIVAPNQLARISIKGATVGDVADVTARGCRTFGLRDPGRLVSVHGSALALQLGFLNSRLKIFGLGANFEALLDAPASADLAGFADGIAEPGSFAIVIDDSGPPRSTRLIARFVKHEPTDEELAAHGVKLIGRQNEWFGNLGVVEATLPGRDLEAAHRALAALASRYPKDAFGCRGCAGAIAFEVDPAKLRELGLHPEAAAAAAAAAGSGLAVARPAGDGGAIRIVLPAEGELDPARIGAVPVGKGVPLSAIARLRTAPRELERIGGKPVVVVWLRAETAERELRDLLPNADVAPQRFENW